MKNFLKFSIFPSVKYLDEKYQNDQKQSKAKQSKVEFFRTPKSAEKSKAKQSGLQKHLNLTLKQSKAKQSEAKQSGNPASEGRIVHVLLVSHK